MPLDPDTLRLAEEMVQFALQMRYGQVVVEVSVRYLVDVRDGKLHGSGVKELLPRVTVEQLRKSENPSVIS